MHHADERLESQIDKGKLLLVTQEHKFSLGNGLDDVARMTGTYYRQPEYTRTIYLAEMPSYFCVRQNSIMRGKFYVIFYIVRPAHKLDFTLVMY